ncbi:MAG: hypothetical protein M1820_007681 [Bogoriella megaspora]|nr:MAG: hypothetical protein M1820_007681 [Bogoriella megaspora]
MGRAEDDSSDEKIEYRPHAHREDERFDPYQLDKQQRDKLGALEQKQRKLHDRLKKIEHFGVQELKSLACESPRDFTVFWAQYSIQTRSSFDQRHERGWRRWVQKYQSFAAGADRFLRDFSPIVEVVKNVGAPYGGLAIGTISAFFVILQLAKVAKNKTKIDNVILAAIIGINDRLPGLNLYETIYREKSSHERLLQTKILNAYAYFVDFFVDATYYYLQSGAHRWWLATWNPDKFQESVNDVQSSIVAVRLHCEELLNSNVKEIKNLNTKLNAEVHDLQNEITDLKKDNDDRSLHGIKVLLGLAAWTEDRRDEMFKDHAWGVERERDNEDLVHTLSPGSVREYKHREHFKSWSACGQSAILLIVGANNQVSRGTYCWMSPLAIDIIRQRNTDCNAHAYYVFTRHQFDMHRAWFEIIFQLVQWKRSALRKNNCFATLSANIEAHNTAKLDSDDDSRFEALCKLVEGMIQIFEPGETVNITLDRIDWCEADQQLDFMRVLMSMLERAQCVVKLLAVAKDTNWEVDETSLPPLKRGQFIKVTEEQRLRY